MSEVRGRALRTAALGFAGVTGYNSIVAIREDLPGEPLRISIPLSVRSGILLGWGAAVAAPWPMPLVALLAAFRPTARDAGIGPAYVCIGLGFAGIVGILIEPNSYRVESWTVPTRRAVLLHVGPSAVLAATGIWHLRRWRATTTR